MDDTKLKAYSDEAKETMCKALKCEGIVYSLPNETEDKVLSVGKEHNEKATVNKDNKISFEDFKTLYKGQIDDKCLADYGTLDDTKLWEDTAKELFLQSEHYIPNEADKAAKMEEAKSERFPSTDFLKRDWEKLQKDPMINAKEHWSDIYYQEVVDFGKSLEDKSKDIVKEAADKKEYTISEADEAKIKELENGSAFTWEGMDTSDKNLKAIVNFFKENTPTIKLPVNFYTWKGKLFNEMYGLTGKNAYPDDLSFLSISLDNWDGLGALPMIKFQVGARWLDDIVDNNAYRERKNENKEFKFESSDDTELAGKDVLYVFEDFDTGVDKKQSELIKFANIVLDLRYLPENNGEFSETQEDYIWSELQHLTGKQIENMIRLCYGKEIADRFETFLDNSLETLDTSKIKYIIKESIETGNSVFELKFDCSNEDNFGIGDSMATPLANVLTNVATKVANGKFDGSILDINGNKIGSYGIGYEGVESGLTESKKLQESVRDDLIQLKEENKSIYDYIANNYYKMSVEELKELALDAIFVANKDSEIIDEYLDRMEEDEDPESVRNALIKLKENNKGLYDYVANNYYKMSRQELKEIALNAVYVADNDNEIISEYVDRVEESVDEDIEKAKIDSKKKGLYTESRENDVEKRINQAKEWKKAIRAAKEIDDLEKVADEILEATEDIKDINYAGEDIYNGFKIVMDDDDALERGIPTYMRSVKRNMRDILDAFIDNYEVAFGEESLKESKSLEDNNITKKAENLKTLADVIKDRYEKDLDGLDVGDNTIDMVVYFDYNPEDIDNSADAFTKCLDTIARNTKIVRLDDDYAVVDFYSFVKDHLDAFKNNFYFECDEDENATDDDYCDEIVETVMPGLVSGYTNDSTYNSLNTDLLTGVKKTESRIKYNVKDLKKEVKAIPDNSNGYDAIDYFWQDEDVKAIQNLLGDAAIVKIEERDKRVLQIEAPQTKYVNGGIINGSDELAEAITELAHKQHPDIEITCMNHGTTFILHNKIIRKSKENKEESKHKVSERSQQTAKLSSNYMFDSTYNIIMLDGTSIGIGKGSDILKCLNDLEKTEYNDWNHKYDKSIKSYLAQHPEDMFEVSGDDGWNPDSLEIKILDKYKGD